MEPAAERCRSQRRNDGYVATLAVSLNRRGNGLTEWSRNGLIGALSFSRKGLRARPLYSVAAAGARVKFFPFLG